MISTLTQRLRRFGRDTEGNITIETAIWLPLMIFVLTSTISLYDAFRYKALNTKAAYTISDAISRETDPLDGLYMDGMVDLLSFLTRSEGPYALRVTQVRYNGTAGQYETEWSQTRGGLTSLQTRDLTAMTDGLPTMLHNERIIVVETETEYVPPFPVPGLNEARLFYNFGFTRPRFAPQIVWSAG